MKKIIIFCTVLYGFSLQLSSLADSLQGKIAYTEDSARIEAFRDIPDFDSLTDKKVSEYIKSQESINNKANVTSAQEFEAKVFKFINLKVTGIFYEDKPDIMFGYIKTGGNYKCILAQVILNSDYPIRIANYDIKTKKLLSVTFEPDEQESFVYSAQGNLIAHWKKEKGQLVDGKTKLQRRILF